MKRIALSIVMITVAASATWALFAAEREPKDSKKGEADKPTMMKLDQAPTAVQAAIKQAAGAAEVTEIEKEIDGEETLYEAAWKVDDVDHEVVVNKLGDVMATEMTVSMDAVPEAVREAAKEQLPKGAKTEFELTTIVLYEVKAMVDDKEVERFRNLFLGEELRAGSREGRALWS